MDKDDAKKMAHMFNVRIMRLILCFVSRTYEKSVLTCSRMAVRALRVVPNGEKNASKLPVFDQNYSQV